MERYILLIFSFVVVFSIVGIIFMLGPDISAMGTYSAGSREGYATQVLSQQRIAKAHGGDGVPRETVLRKGALDTTGSSACPSGYRLAAKYECLFIPCIPVDEAFRELHLGKLCKPLEEHFPIYPEEGILK